MPLEAGEKDNCEILASHLINQPRQAPRTGDGGGHQTSGVRRMGMRFTIPQRRLAEGGEDARAEASGLAGSPGKTTSPRSSASYRVLGQALLPSR
jgi:hypothetical protein